MEGILVNGPINAARLEGNINGIHKVLYLFMDIHSDISTQTQCKNFDNVDLVRYVVDMLKLSNKNKTFDIFTEISGTAIASPDYPYRGRYIDEINRYLKSEFKSKNKINPNVRVHYIDIRDFLKTNINTLIYNINNTIRNITVSKFVSRFDYDNLIKFFKDLKDNVYLIYSIMFNKESKQSRINNDIKVPIRSQNEKENFKIIKNFINKIMHRYNHQDLTNKFKPVFDSIKYNFEKILKLINEAIDLMKKSFDFLSKPNDVLFLQDYRVVQLYSYGKDTMKFLEFAYKIEVLINEIDVLCLFNFATIVDIFFLRRFLDKDYITNGIVYTGVAHSIFYIYFLIKEFNFNIMNVSFSNIKDTNSIEKKIKESEFGPEIEKIFMPSIFSQCIDMTQFPKGFE